VAVPIVLAVKSIVLAVKPTAELVIFSAELAAEPSHMVVFKAVSKGRMILLLLLRHGKL